jgi:hypothetical protein
MVVRDCELTSKCASQGTRVAAGRDDGDGAEGWRERGRGATRTSLIRRPTAGACELGIPKVLARMLVTHPRRMELGRERCCNVTRAPGASHVV